MTAVYPAAVKTFAYRQDYTELVEAADVNVSYDEINATQKTLGVLPNTDTIDGAVSTWPTVGNRISAVAKGVSHPFCNVSANNIMVPYETHTVVQWTNKTWDTHGIWGGGTQLICPRSGVYTFNIYIRWHQDSMPNDNQQPVFNRSGQLKIALTPTNTPTDITNQGGYYPQGWQKANHQSASMTLPWVKGNAITMEVNQQCLTTGIIATALCSITYHRDPPTPNNL
ncbi:MAG TPA: hypothetical protein VGF75_01870 [Candidatus Saccharimonadales bacterium]